MMGILPLQFAEGENAESLGLSGREEFAVVGVDNAEAREVTVRADEKEFRARVRLDTPVEREYLRHGGILPFVLRRLLADSRAEMLGDAGDSLLVPLLGQPQPVAVLAVRLDHTVDVLPRLPVRIRRLCHN